MEAQIPKKKIRIIPCLKKVLSSHINININKKLQVMIKAFVLKNSITFWEVN